VTLGARVLVTLVPFVYLVLLGTGVCVWLAVGPLHALSRVSLFVCMVPALLELVAAGSAFGGRRSALSGRVAVATAVAPVLLFVWAGAREPMDAPPAQPVWPSIVAFTLLHAGVCALFALWERAAARRSSDTARAAQP
jgi:hypothetical protein